MQVRLRILAIPFLGLLSSFCFAQAASSPSAATPSQTSTSPSQDKPPQDKTTEQLPNAPSSSHRHRP